MNPLLISGFGTNISVDKRRLIIQNKLENQRYEYYPHQIKHDSVIVDGHSGSISFEAMRWLVKHNIPIAMLNWNGNLLSVTLPKETVSSKLRLKQYKIYQDGKRRYSIAYPLVKEKVNQSINLLNELSKYYKEIDVSTIRTESEREGIFKLKITYDYHNLMMYEGRIADIYWSQILNAFNNLCPEFKFVSRNNTLNSHNRNASDEINALLNYGYAVLESEVRKDLNSIGLDPSISFLHELSNSRASLVYDIQELYRWLVDLSVIQLLEEKRLQKADFIVTENYNIRLRETTAKALIEKIKLNFNARALYNGKYYCYQNILYENVRLLANYIIGKSGKLQFNIPEFKIKREDNTGIRNKVLNLTPEDRKTLGINKSTLWYMQKHIKEGRKIKVYGKVMGKLNGEN
ncbi:MAG: CRISPR-associated endonuclease Cas1 [Candidatus Micrarchaeota archaeon]|nr:CRISPR-associated endonuclease Cas1 [Candidatus Micrarchaeota archaeon]MDE1847645.1 CRISPR-associated endonuclease Cas1 [Candidatus Micrarchaeota archaeon]MDE1864466.1 CRISPR-associated endonuclease Cas1 [Candidatus Micrarchaeota archaeon]